MRTALLCISAEPGRDGVGDYVRRLAAALSSRGHPCLVVALADPFVNEPWTGADDTASFEIVRLPQPYWRQGRLDVARESLRRFAPEWVSLQMVCYGFERRGLLWRSARRFALLRAAPRRHLMFHELWIGAHRDSSAKERAVGWLQRKLLQRATRLWSPRLVHTSNRTYRQMLRAAHIDAEELPLPGNIPVEPVDRDAARALLLAQLSGAPGGVPPLLAGVFGSIHPQWSDPQWMDQVAARCAELGRRLVIVQLGRAGSAGLKVLADLRAHAAGQVQFLQLGERPAPELSTLLQGLDFGVATTPWNLIGKSGSAAAMLEHGLQVLVTRDAETAQREPAASPHPRLLRLSEFLVALAAGTLSAIRPQPRPEIYDAFIGSLERAS